MKSVTVLGKSANEIIEIVHQMKAYGWKVGIDFDYEYHKPSEYDGFYNRYTIFNFYNEELSTYFALRWL